MHRQLHKSNKICGGILSIENECRIVLFIRLTFLMSTEVNRHYLVSIIGVKTLNCLNISVKAAIPSNTNQVVLKYSVAAW